MAVLNSISGKTKRPSPQNMNARLDGGAADSSMVRTKGIMYGQNERAKVPKAHKKITVTMRKGTSSQRYCTLNASKTVAIAPIMGNTNKYGRSTHISITSRCSASE